VLVVLLRRFLAFEEEKLRAQETAALGALRDRGTGIRSRSNVRQDLDAFAVRHAAVGRRFGHRGSEPRLALANRAPRGIRTSLWRPDLLRTQLRALLRVTPRGQCRVLLPMITEAGEIREVRRILAEERGDLGLAQTLALGVMIETPAAALTSTALAAEADFLSIGTNDLTQYALAMDRGHPQLAAQLDALHPAVLRLIAATVDGARKHGRRVSVCGGIASDLAAAPVLIGLGIVGLSAVPSKIAELKASVRPLTLEGCRALAARALEVDSAAAVRALAAQKLKAVS